MERHEEEHLTAAEIAGFLEAGRGEGLLAERVNHARSCALCGRVIEMHEEQESRLRQLGSGPQEALRAGCPTEAELTSLAAGLVESERGQALLAHVSECDGCGALLRTAIEDLSDDRDTEESEKLAALESARPEWQRSLARRMALAARPSPPMRLWLWLTEWHAAQPPGWVWKVSAAALILAIGAGWWSYDHWVLSHPARLIAQAYTAQRPFDFRIEGAGYGLVQIQRGFGSSFRRPASLVEAEERIARELAKKPDSAEWLALHGRAELLALDAENAIANLTRAVDQRPDDPVLLADLGTAYALRAERAEAQGRAADYRPAIEHLTRSIRARPKFPEAVFNRALVYERLLEYDEAIRQWRLYLSLDASGGWADEARSRLTNLEAERGFR